MKITGQLDWMHIARNVDVQFQQRQNVCHADVPFLFLSGKLFYQEKWKKKLKEVMKFRIRKIHLHSFIQKLMEIYNSGVDYVDLNGEMSSKKDILEVQESEHSTSMIDLDGDITDYI